MSKKSCLSLLLLVAIPVTLQAAALSPEASAADQAYQEGLYLQRTVGDLDGALQSYDRALKAGQLTQSGKWVEDVLLRRAEAEQWRGRTAEAQKALTALDKQDPSAQELLGPARHFPSQFDLILQLRPAELLAAPLIKELDLEAEWKPAELKQLVEVLGFDPLRELRRITVGGTLPEDLDLALSSKKKGKANGAGRKGEPENKDDSGSSDPHRQMEMKVGLQHYLLVVEGELRKFAPERLFEAVKEAGVKVVGHDPKFPGGDLTVLEWPAAERDPREREKAGLVRFAEDLVAFGDLDSLRDYALARLGRAPGLKDNPKLSAVTSRLPAGSTFWMVAAADKVLGAAHKLGGILGKGGDAPLLSGLMVTAKFTRDVVLTASAWAEDLSSAETLSDIARGLVVLAHLLPVDETSVGALLKSLTVETKDREVRVSATMPGRLLIEASKEKAQATDSAKPKKPVRMEIRAEKCGPRSDSDACPK